MAMKLTNKSVADLKLTTGKEGQYIVRDTDLKNFFVVVGRKERTYTFQVDTSELGKRKTTRKTVGRHPGTDASEARKEAKRLIGSLQTGHAKHGGHGVTLGDAWASFRDQFAHQVEAGTKSAASLRSYRHAIENVLGDWQDAKLRDLSDGPAMGAARHREITKTNGKASANVTMRCLRIVYNHARKTRLERDLPAGLPTDAINWNPQARRYTGMALADLAGWYKKLRAMNNPVREEFHLFTLLSASRPNALRQARWDWYDVEAATLTFPKDVMKGHSDFVMPLSPLMIECLERARAAAEMTYPQAPKTYIFPGPGAAGHLADTTEARKRLSHWGGDLRQTYVTATKAIGLGGYEARFLLNHAAGDTHDGYATTHALNGLMMDAQKRMSEYLTEGLGQ